MKQPRSRVARYSIALLAVTLALSVKALIAPFVAGESPFLLLSVAVLIVAALGGFGPAILATFLGGLVGDYFFLSPVGTLVPPTSAHGFRTALFLGQGLLISAIGAMLVSARQRAESNARRAEEGRESLRQSEERYRALIEQVGEGILLFDAKTMRILQANAAFREMLGYNADELSRMSVYDLVSGSQQSVDRNLESTLENGYFQAGERMYRHRNGSVVEVEVSGNVVQFAGQELVCAVARDISERKRADEALREVREAERSRIAREMHDTVLKDLVYALQGIQIASQVHEGLPQSLIDSLDESAEALRNSVEGLREAIFELRLEEMTDRSVRESLNLLVDTNRRMARRAYRLELEVDEGFPDRLPARVAREILRVVQEALTNARRHASPSDVRVRLGVEEEYAWVEVADDGRGFESSRIQHGVGSYSMRQRAHDIGGELRVQSAPGQGTRVWLQLPREQLNQEPAQSGDES